jgi:hypothetical protein
VCKALIHHSATLAAVRFAVNPAPGDIDADIEALPDDEPGSGDVEPPRNSP